MRQNKKNQNLNRAREEFGEERRIRLGRRNPSFWGFLFFKIVILFVFLSKCINLEEEEK